MNQDSEQNEGSDASPRRGRWSYIVVALVLATLGAVGYGTYYWYRNSTSEVEKPRAAVTVTAAKAKKQTWKTVLSAVGSVVPVQGTELTSELAGRVVEINFESGAQVDAGDLLVRLDTSSEQAQLDALKPQLRQAKSDQARVQSLIDQLAVSEEKYEESLAEVDRLQAEIDRQLAIIDRKQITAPFGGKLGIRMVSLGQFVEPGSAVFNLQQIVPIFVDFDVPEGDAGQVNIGQIVVVRVAAFPGETFQGTVMAVTPLIKRATRSFTVRAELSNEDGKLLPGMFADVTVQLPQQRDVVTVPDTAIAFNAYGRSVFVIQPADATDKQSADDESNDQPTVKRTFVQVGERRGLVVEIIKGIQVGTRVVTAGQLKLSDGSPVRITEQDVMNKAEARPTQP